MSLSYQQLKPIKVVDPLLEVQDILGTAVIEGANQLSYKQFTSTSISSSSIQFTCNPPSGNTVVDRLVYIQLPVRLTMTGRVITTNAGYVPSTSLLNANHDAPRKFALQSAMETLQITINGDSVSQNMSDIIHPLTGYHESDEARLGVYSMSGVMRDQSANYSDLVGFERNPLGVWGNSTQGGTEPRGSLPTVSIVAGTNVAVVPAVAPGTAATAIVDMVLTEPIFLSPFYFGKQDGDKQGFYNVTNMDYNLNFLANAGFRMWAHNSGAISSSGGNSITSVIDTIQVSFNNFSPQAFTFTDSQPKMLFKYLTPNLLTNAKLGPLIPQTYPYFDIQRFVTDIGTVPYSATGSTTKTSNNIQLSTIPRKMYVFARPSNSVLQSRADITDCYLPISRISIQFENQSAILSSASKRQLYLIDQKNGGGMSYTQWSGETVYSSAFSTKYATGAGPLCLDFGLDIALNDPSLAPGVNGQFNLQVEVDIANRNAGLQWDALSMSLYLVLVQEGSFTVPSLGNAQHQVGILSKQDVMMAQESEGVSFRDAMQGGNFLSTLGNIASGVNDFLKKTKLISSVASMIPHPIAQAVSPVASSLGYGVIQGGQLVNRDTLVKSLAVSVNQEEVDRLENQETAKKYGIRRRLMDR